MFSRQELINGEVLKRYSNRYRRCCSSKLYCLHNLRQLSSAISKRCTITKKHVVENVVCQGCIDSTTHKNQWASVSLKSLRQRRKQLFDGANSKCKNQCFGNFRSSRLTMLRHWQLKTRKRNKEENANQQQGCFKIGEHEMREALNQTETLIYVRPAASLLESKDNKRHSFCSNFVPIVFSMEIISETKRSNTVAKSELFLLVRLVKQNCLVTSIMLALRQICCT